MCGEGKILAIAQYVIKYDYRGNTKGNTKISSHILFFSLLAAIVDSFYSILLTFFLLHVHFEVE